MHNRLKVFPYDDKDAWVFLPEHLLTALELSEGDEILLEAIENGFLIQKGDKQQD